MKSVVLNDLYNISHNAKQMIFLLVFWAVCFFTSIDKGGYIILCAILASMMTITTFSFDEKCDWAKYVLVMPNSRKGYVAAKYLTNLIFSMAGILWGMVITTVVCLMKGNFDILQILFCAYGGIAITVLLSCVWIPLLIKFGAEKSRMIMIAVVALPVLLVAWIGNELSKRGMLPSMQMLKMIAYISPLLLILLVAVTMSISIKIFQKKEF